MQLELTKEEVEFIQQVLGELPSKKVEVKSKNVEKDDLDEMLNNLQK